MPPNLCNVKYARLPETAHVWSERLGAWVTAYRTDFIQQFTHTFIDNITFDATTTSKTSREFHTAPYQKFLLLINLIVASSPTDIVIAVQFSDDRANWYKYMQGPFGDLRYEDAAGDKMECISGPVLAPWMRLYVVATGTSGSNKFTLTGKVVLTG